jgi:hypothetical protein
MGWYDCLGGGTLVYRYSKVQMGGVRPCKKVNFFEEVDNQFERKSSSKGAWEG